MNDTAAIVSQLQKASYDSYRVVVQNLSVGMSEKEIAQMLREEMNKRGMQHYWYDVPIFVLIGTDRFLQIKQAGHDYAKKSPGETTLEEGSVVYIDLHPQDEMTGQWGDWNSMFVFHPRFGVDDEQVAFLDEMRSIQRGGIEKIRSTMTAAAVSEIFFSAFEKHGVTLSDPLNNVGHSIHAVPKSKSKRVYLDKETFTVMGEGLYAIEPGGYRQKRSGNGIVVGRFEECISITEKGAEILGRQQLLPLIY